MKNNSKKRFVMNLTDELPSEEETNFATLFEHSQLVKEGSIIKGKVIGLESNIVIIDINSKNEGRVPISEFELDQNAPLPKIGDLVDVYVEKIENYYGKTILSREKAISEEIWEQLEKAYKSAELVDGVIFGRVKGGLAVDLSGVVAFLPGSQVDIRPVKDINPLLNIVQPFQILKMDKKLSNIVVSRRSVLEASRSEAKEELLSNIKQGVVLEGIVKNITDYGAFIDLGSADGLLHITDIAWRRVNHPSEVLSLGQKVEVMVIKFDEKIKRISLGMKQIDESLWQEIQSEFVPGQIRSGKITNIADYGVFIELQNGIEGLVHASEISWNKNNQSLKKLLNIGQEVQFKVIEVDSKKHRVSLSIKQCSENPWQNFLNKNPLGSVVKTKVKTVTDFGLFVTLNDEIDGLIHASDLSWDGNGLELLKKYKKDDEIDCKVLAADIEKERINLGIKQLNSDSFEVISNKYNKNDTINCIIDKIRDDGIEVTVEDSLFRTFIEKSELFAKEVEQKLASLSVRGRISAKIISIDKSNRKINLSVKALDLDGTDKGN